MARSPEWESDFQSRTIIHHEAEGWTVYKLEPGSGTLPKHWPDTMWLYAGGLVMFVEFKSWGGTVEPGQRRILKMLATSGFNVCFCDPRPEHCAPAPMTIEEIEAYEPPGYPGDNARSAADRR